MPYEPTNWKDGDLVTSAKLNKLEQGVAAGGGITFVEEVYPESPEEFIILNKTWQEIYDAAESGMVYFKKIFDLSSAGTKRTSSNAKYIKIYPLFTIGTSMSFYIKFIDADTSSLILYEAESADDYPILQDTSDTQPA